MKNGVEDFVVESTPVLDLKKHGLAQAASVNSASENNWDSDRTEVYADADSDSVVASLIGEHGEVYPITTFPFVIGRGSECDLVLQGKGVSRRHSEIIFQSGRFVVNDLESLNGLKVNGYKVARVILEENDIVKLGDVSFTFRAGNSNSDSDKKSETGGKKAGGLFGAGKVGKPAESDGDPFGPKPLKRVLVNVAVVCMLGVVGYAGYKYWAQRSQSQGELVAGAIVQQSPKVVTNSATQQPQSRAQTQPQAPVTNTGSSSTSGQPNVAATDSSSVEPPPSISPPPSIAVGSQSRAVASSDPVSSTPGQLSKAVVSAPPAIKEVKAAPRVDNTSRARDALGKADQLYFQGDADAALAKLKAFVDDPNVAAATRKDLRQSYNNYSGLYSQYQAGKASYTNGDKENAFQVWTSFMQKESDLFGERKSAYTRSISSKVISEYVDLGNAAAKKGDNHTAYRMWQKALDLGESVPARIALDNANNKAMQMYRQALRLEYVNTSKAKTLWRDVTELLPPGTEYNTKASAKLAWYEKWGS